MKNPYKSLFLGENNNKNNNEFMKNEIEKKITFIYNGYMEL